MTDEFDMPTFAFHELDYVPWGVGGVLAPYIETPAATMRAAATLMGLDLTSGSILDPSSEVALRTVVCDLGCGDGDFLVNLLNHLNIDSCSISAVHGVGIDYDAQLIQSAIDRSCSAGQSVQWLKYDFNEDKSDLASQLLDIYHITHVFIYLLPKQLELDKVRRILTRLCESGVTVCCHKFQPAYLTGTRHDIMMDLVVYEKSLGLAGVPATLVDVLPCK